MTMPGALVAKRDMTDIEKLHNQLHLLQRQVLKDLEKEISENATRKNQGELGS